MASSRLLRRCAVISLLLALLLACAPQTVLLLNRALVLSLALSPAVLLSPAAAASSTIHQCLFLPALRHALGRSAALTKWGQWAATRPDLVPPSVCEALSVLHAHAPAHAAAISRAEVEAATGASIEDYFDAWEDEPLASGSIGQVHLARRTDSASSVMRDSFLPQVHLARLNGSAVAVKVRHPRVGAELEADFRLLELLARAVDSVPGLRWLDAQSTVKQFGWALQRQASLEEEARWLRLVGRNFEAWGDVLLPAPLSASPSVLIETLVPGAPIGEYINFAAATASAHDPIRGRARQLSVAQRHYIVQRGVDIYYKMLLADNLMHADLHPGNLLFSADGRGGLGTIGMVDLGMTAVLTASEQHNFIGFLQAVGEGDGRAAARCVLRWAGGGGGSGSGGGGSGGGGYGAPAGEASLRDVAFADAMASSFGRHCRGYGHGIDLGVVLRETLSLIREHRVAVGANYVTLVVNAMCLEGMARQLVPEYNVMDAARPLLVAHAKLPRSIFGAISPAARFAKRVHDRTVLQRLLREGARIAPRE